MSSVDYNPSINVRNTKSHIKLTNEDSDLFEIKEIEIVGESNYHAIVSVGDDYEEIAPFVINDYHYECSSDIVSLDDISIDIKNRIPNVNNEYDEVTIEKYNQVIDEGLKK